MPANAELQQRLGSIEELLRKIESAADPSLRSTVQELVELVMSLHGAGIERMLELTHASGEPGEAVIRRFGSDELVSSLLVLHGLHPLTLEDRVQQALEKVRLRLRPLNGEVEFLSCSDGVARLRVHANGQGCGSTAQTLKQMVEETLYQAAPDLTTLIVEGAEEKQGFVPLETLLGNAVLQSHGKGGM